MKYLIFPSKQQWQQWAAPRKFTAVGACIGTIGVVFTMVAYLSGFETAGQQRVESNFINVHKKLERFNAEKDKFETLKFSVHQRVQSVAAEQQDLQRQMDALNRKIDVARTNMINTREAIREMKQRSKWYLEDVNIKYELIQMDSHTLFELGEKLELIKKRQAELRGERRRLEASEENTIARIDHIVKQIKIEKQ